MDIYHDELQTWTTLVAMTPLERAAWRREKLGRLEGRELPVKSALSMNEFTALTVKDIVQVTEDSFVYTISLPEGHCLGYQPGQHCILRGFVDSSECSVTRQYTPISPPDEDGSFAVLIKLYKDGRVSEVIRAWAVGTVTEWKGPFGGLNYKPNNTDTWACWPVGPG